MPALGLSLLLIAVGAILTFAVEVTVSGFNLDAAGIILMIVGGIGAVLSLLFWTSFAPFAHREPRVPTEDVHVHREHRGV